MQILGSIISHDPDTTKTMAIVKYIRFKK